MRHLRSATLLTLCSTAHYLTMGNPGYKIDAGKQSKPQRADVKRYLEEVDDRKQSLAEGRVQMYLEEVDDRKHFLAGGPTTSHNIEDTRRRIEGFDRTWERGENQHGSERWQVTLPSSHNGMLMTQTERFWILIGLLGLSI